MPLISDTVAIPVVGGINVNTPARLLEATQLLEATNVRFPAGAGAKKRRGHTGQRIRGAKQLPPSKVPPSFAAPLHVPAYFTGDRGLDANWVFGLGFYYETGEGLLPVKAPAATPLATAPHPEEGYCFGVAARDSETLAWGGHRLFSRTTLDIPGGKFAELNAVMPALRSEPIAKANVAQRTPDCADNGIIRVATWITDGVAYYSAVDASLGTTLVPATALVSGTASYVRCVPTGPWIHILIAESNTGELVMRSIHQDAPADVQYRGMGDCNGAFDVWKAAGTSFLTARATDTTIMVRWHDSDGSITSQWLADVGFPTLISSVALCIEPQGEESIAIVWRADGFVMSRVFSEDGSALGAALPLGAATAVARPVAVAPRYSLEEGSGFAMFNAYWDDSSGGTASVKINRFTLDTPGLYTATRYHHLLGSQGFRVGDRTFIWAGHNSDFQSKWILLDEELLPVGHAEYITANTPVAADFPALFSVNWTGEASTKDRLVYHCGISYRVRVAVEPTTAGVNPPPVYSEPSIKFVKLDFLPPLRSAQAGRCTYFAGAQLWVYDGNKLVEACFHYAPEEVTLADSASGDLNGDYIYRVDICHRNAQNEEVRSPSFYTDSVTSTGGVLLTIQTCITRRSDSYFLIYRNENAGTTWKLCNSRDPSSPLFLSNDQTVPSVQYTDSTVSDVELSSREPHPNQSFDYLDPFVAPASEVIAAGRDRLWLSGGEIAAGQVYPSRLFDPGQTPAFHGDLAIQVDRSAEPITAIGFVGEFTVFFRRSQSYIEDGIGPDNIQQGDWNGARLAEPSLGAVGPESLGLINTGLVFQSPAGIRLLTQGGGLIPIGQPVDSIAKDLDITAAVVVGPDQEIRFYSWSGETLVYNYQYNIWSKWGIPAAGAVRNTETGLVRLCTPTASLWEETDGVWTDDSQPFKQRIRFAWLRAGNLLDFQRVRRIGAIGSGTDHDIHVDVYYNEREFAEEWFDWSVPDAGTHNEDTFGSENFGDGNFGDDTAAVGTQFRDSTWPWRRRLHRQKCSVISIAIDDSYTNGEGFTLTALALELAKKKGLDRSPWRGGTYTNTGGSGSSETGN